jgi:hypothetical protein
VARDTPLRVWSTATRLELDTAVGQRTRPSSSRSTIESGVLPRPEGRPVPTARPGRPARTSSCLAVARHGVGGPSVQPLGIPGVVVQCHPSEVRALPLGSTHSRTRPPPSPQGCLPRATRGLRRGVGPRADQRCHCGLRSSPAVDQKRRMTSSGRPSRAAKRPAAERRLRRSGLRGHRTHWGLAGCPCQRVRRRSWQNATKPPISVRHR